MQQQWSHVLESKRPRKKNCLAVYQQPTIVQIEAHMVKYFHFHSPSGDDFDQPLDTVRCTASSKGSGNRCKNRVTIGLSTCWQHTLSQKFLQVKTSTIPNAGDGLFARKGPIDDRSIVVFKSGDVICQYNGEMISQQTLESRYGQFTAPYGVELRAGRKEDGALSRGIGTLINHYPRKKNCRIAINRANRAQIISMKTIKNGDELFVSYGRSYRFNEGGVETSTNNRKYAI